MSSTNIDFAKFIGIESLPAAIVFAILYVPFLVFFAFKAIGRRIYVYIILTIFCAIRVAAFTVRAVLAGSTSAGGSLGLVVAETVLSGVGYFGLLYSAYTVVMDCLQLSNFPRTDLPILRIVQDRRVFRFALLIAVILGVIAASRTTSNGPSTSSSTKALHIASTVLFLVLTVVQAALTIFLGISERGHYKQANNSIGSRHRHHILLAIVLLLLIREIFITATVSNAVKQDNEHFWYPLVAVPEIIAIQLYSTPGLIPEKGELQQSSKAETEDATVNA